MNKMTAAVYKTQVDAYFNKGSKQRNILTLNDFDCEREVQARFPQTQAGSQQRVALKTQINLKQLEYLKKMKG